MANKKRAWLYCAIDAPEDERGMLKKQWRAVTTYAEQMDFDIVGTSSDMGFQPFWIREGFQPFLEQARKGEIDILLLSDLRCLSNHSRQQFAQLQELLKSLDVTIYTPLTGAI